MKSRPRLLVLILVVGLSVRAGLFLAALGRPEAPFSPDSQAYVRAAGELRHLATFSTGGTDGRHEGDDRPPEINRTPGYPVFLLLAWGLWRSESLPWQVAIVAQILLDTVLVCLTYRLGRSLAGEGVGLGAAAFQAVSPVVIASSCRILSDGLFAFVLTAAMLLVIGHLKSGKLPRLIGAAAVVALACYVRPMAMILAGVVVVVLLCGRRRWLLAGAFAGVFVACVAPWVVRNAMVADYYGFSSNGGDTLYYFYTPEVLVRTEGIDGQTARHRVEDEARRYADQHQLTAGAAARWRQQKALELIAAHPWLYARIHLTGCLGFWLPGATDVLELTGATRGSRNTLEVLRQEGLVAAVEHYFRGNKLAVLAAIPMVLILLVKYVGVVACIVVGLRRGVPAAAWLLAAMVVASALLTGPFGLPRYRVPVEAILNAGAAVGWGALLARIMRSSHQTTEPVPGR